MVILHLSNTGNQCQSPLSTIAVGLGMHMHVTIGTEMGPAVYILDHCAHSIQHVFHTTFILHLIYMS